MKVELPRINDKYHSKKHRYVYATDYRFDVNVKTDKRSLTKIDTAKEALSTWSAAGCYPGEPVFILSPESAKEDDGIVLSVVLDGIRKHSFLLVLNAADFTELGRANIPHSIPAGLHGQYFP